MKKIFSRRDPLISLGGNPNPSTTEKEPIKVNFFLKIYTEKKIPAEIEICSKNITSGVD